MLYPKRMLKRRHGLSARALMDELQTVGVITCVYNALRHCTAIKKGKKYMELKMNLGEISSLPCCLSVLR